MIDLAIAKTEFQGETKFLQMVQMACPGSALALDCDRPQFRSWLCYLFAVLHFKFHFLLCKMGENVMLFIGLYWLSEVTHLKRLVHCLAHRKPEYNSCYSITTITTSSASTQGFLLGRVVRAIRKQNVRLDQLYCFYSTNVQLQNTVSEKENQDVYKPVARFA